MNQLFRAVVADRGFYASSEMNAFEIIQQFVINEATDIICDFVGFSETSKDKTITKELVISAYPIIKALKEANNITDFKKLYEKFCDLFCSKYESLVFSSELNYSSSVIKKYNKNNMYIFVGRDEIEYNSFFARTKNDIDIIDLSDQIDRISTEKEYSKEEFQNLYESFTTTEAKK